MGPEETDVTEEATEELDGPDGPGPDPKPCPAPHDKATQMAKRKRVEQVKDLIMLGMPSPQIQRQIAKDHGVTERQGRRDLNQAYEELHADEQVDVAERRKLRTRHIAQLRGLYWSALKAKNYGACVRTMKEIALICGLYSPTRLQLDGDVGLGGELKVELSPDAKAEALTNVQRIERLKVVMEKLGLPMTGAPAKPTNGHNGANGHG